MREPAKLDRFPASQRRQRDQHIAVGQKVVATASGSRSAETILLVLFNAFLL